MASREFTDDRGALWRVWDVQPDTLERRTASDPLLGPAIERRRTPQLRVLVSNPDMVRGWLAFESRGERRRLAPIPDHWEVLSVVDLRQLLAQARPTRRVRRLIE